jgi:hypothetical protein
VDDLTAERYPEFTGRRLLGHAARLVPRRHDPPEHQERRQAELWDLGELDEEVDGGVRQSAA